MFTADTFDLSTFTPPTAKKQNRRGKARDLTPAEINLLFSEFPDTKWVAIFGLAYFTGSRINEILSMKADQLTEDCVYIYPSKKRGKAKYRVIARSEQLNQIIDVHHFPTDGYLFPGRWNSKASEQTHITRQGADKVLRKASEAVGLEGVSTHSFRRSFVTELKRQGWQITQIQRLLGHESAHMTAGYDS